MTIRDAFLTMLRVTWGWMKVLVTICRLDTWIYFNLTVIRKTITSKKFIDLCDHSAVNFIIGWIERFSLRVFTKFLNFSSPCSQIKEVSSIYLHHKYGLLSTILGIFFSSYAINKILQGEANFVAIAVPLFCFKVFSLKLKILCFKTNSANSTSVSVDTSSLSFLLSFFLRADNPSSCGILGYKSTTSTVDRRLLLGKFLRERSFFMKSLVSLIYNLIVLAIGCKWKSKNEEIFSV